MSNSLLTYSPEPSTTSPSSDNPDVVDFVDPKQLCSSKVFCSGRFPYSRDQDRTVQSFDTVMGKVTVGMWLGGLNKVEQQDAVFVAEDSNQNLWISVVDGLGGHPGGAEASQLCCDVLKEEIETGSIHVDYLLRNKMRLRMARDRVIMSDPRRTGGACIAMACINSTNEKLQSYSMGDVEICVQRDGENVVLANELDRGGELNAVSKIISPLFKGEFTYSEAKLMKGDRILIYSDGLTNKAFKAFGNRYGTVRNQIRNAIWISQHENGVNADNLTVACLERFEPNPSQQGIYAVQLGGDQGV